MVKNDPLGEAFGVEAFHRCQVNNLLRTQLIPVEPECSDQAIVTSTSSPGTSVSISERPVPVMSNKGVTPVPDTLPGSGAGMVLPAFPALTRARTMPGHTGQKRDRSEDDSEDNKAKLAKTLEEQAIRSPRNHYKTKTRIYNMPCTFRCSRYFE